MLLKEERFLSELRDTQSSLEATRGLMKEIHQYKRNLTGQVGGFKQVMSTLKIDAG